MVSLTATTRSQKVLLVLGVLLLVAVFCLTFMGRGVARARGEGENAEQPANGENQEGDEGGGNEDYPTPPIPKPDSNFDPFEWITSQTGMLVSLAWAVFVILMVLFILFHSGKMAAGGQMGQVEGKSGVIRVIMAIALGAGGWFITMFIINLF